MTIVGSPSFVTGQEHALQINATIDHLNVVHTTNNLECLPVYRGSKLPALPSNEDDKTIFGERGGAAPIFPRVGNVRNDNGSRTKLDV